MTAIDENIVNLDSPPSVRWSFLSGYKKEIKELIAYYLGDFTGSEFLIEGISQYKHAIIPSEYLEEIDFISSLSDFNSNQVLTANLYYDILKFYFGCTAFAVQAGDSVIHARNLDWHTENGLLARNSMIFDFRKGGTTAFKSVGWPGFIGVLSGMSPGKFAVTLNAVLSNDNPELAFPVSLLLRQVLAQAGSFSEAQQILETKPLSSDCLLLLSGVGPDEKVVIERTPKRVATRTAEKFVVVTNDYKKLDNHEVINGNQLQVTSCGRFDRATRLLNAGMPQTADACMKILQDPEVMMNITVQQMVFQTAIGEMSVNMAEDKQAI